MINPDGVAPIRIVGVSALISPLAPKSPEKGHKMVVCVCVCVVLKYTSRTHAFILMWQRSACSSSLYQMYLRHWLVVTWVNQYKYQLPASFKHI